MPAHPAEVPDRHGEPDRAPRDTAQRAGAHGGTEPEPAARLRPEEERAAGVQAGTAGQPGAGPEGADPEDGRNEPIDPAGVVWSRVDERYITVRLIGGVGGWLLTSTIVLVPLALGWFGVWDSLPVWVQALAIAVVVVWAAVDLWLIPRRVRAIGYEERQDDLLIRRGLLFQRVVAVPYGRLQYVDIEAGPLMRKFGLCTVQLKTASAATDAEIPGVVRAEGARLREELSARGQARLAGL